MHPLCWSHTCVHPWLTCSHCQPLPPCVIHDFFAFPWSHVASATATANSMLSWYPSRSPRFPIPALRPAAFLFRDPETAYGTLLLTSVLLTTTPSLFSPPFTTSSCFTDHLALLYLALQNVAFSSHSSSSPQLPLPYSTSSQCTVFELNSSAPPLHTFLMCFFRAISIIKRSGWSAFRKGSLRFYTHSAHNSLTDTL